MTSVQYIEKANYLNELTLPCQNEQARQTQAHLVLFVQLLGPNRCRHGPASTAACGGIRQHTRYASRNIARLSLI